MIFRLCCLFAGLTAVAAPAAETAAERFAAIRREASPAELYALLWALPKGGDLHNHLGGAGWPEVWWAIATDPQRNGGQVFYARTRFANAGTSGLNWRGRNLDHMLGVTIRGSSYDKLPAGVKAEFKALRDFTAEEKAAWMSGVVLDQPGEGRDEFFEFTWARLNELILDAHTVPELLVENMKRFGAEGLRYLEFQAPAFGMQDQNGKVLPPEEMAKRYEARLAQPDAVATGVTVRFLSTVLRFAPIAEAEIGRTYAFLDAHRDRWVGINMAGREDNDKGFPRRFLETYRAMRRQYPGIGISIHAGEVDEPNAHVRDTLLLGATRIGHGVNLITDPDTMLLMRANRFLVEINLVSNQLLEYTPDVTVHPFPEYLRFGIPVCLNTDDRGMWHSNMTDEYYTAVRTFALTWDETVSLGRASLEYAFLPAPVKAKLLAEYEAAVAAFAAKMLGADWRKTLETVKAEPSPYAKRTWKM